MGGSRHDIDLEWFASEKDNLLLERTKDGISIYKVYFFNQGSNGLKFK